MKIICLRSSIMAMWLFSKWILVLAHRDIDDVLSMHIEGLLDIPTSPLSTADSNHYFNSTLFHINTLDSLYSTSQNEQAINHTSFKGAIKHAIHKAMSKHKIKRAAIQINKLINESPASHTVSQPSLSTVETRIIKKALQSTRITLDTESIKNLKQIRPSLLMAFHKAMSSSVGKSHLKSVFAKENPINASTRIFKVRQLVTSSLSKEDQENTRQLLDTWSRHHSDLVRRKVDILDLAVGATTAATGALFVLAMCAAATGVFGPLILFGFFAIWYAIVMYCIKRAKGTIERDM